LEIPCIITGTEAEEQAALFVVRAFHDHSVTTDTCCRLCLEYAL